MQPYWPRSGWKSPVRQARVPTRRDYTKGTWTLRGTSRKRKCGTEARIRRLQWQHWVQDYVPGEHCTHAVTAPPSENVPSGHGVHCERPWATVATFWPASQLSQARGVNLPVLGQWIVSDLSMKRLADGSYTPATCHLRFTRLPNAIGSTRCARLSNTTLTGRAPSAALSLSVLFQALFTMVRATNV